MLRVDLHAVVPDEYAFERLDRVASELFPEYSRSRLQNWIKSGELTVDGVVRKPRAKVLAGENLEVHAEEQGISYEPEDLPLQVEFEDEHIIVINKPAGLVMHPGAGNPAGTMLNGLLAHCSQLQSIPRAGIVHRLDKDTTGLLVVAKTLTSQHHLVQQLQQRTVSRIYDAVVCGRVMRQGQVDAPIGRHPRQRTRMSIQSSGKEAITHYSAVRIFEHHTHLRLKLETGRTHQIRVHMQELGYPLVGDSVYGGRFRRNLDLSESLIELVKHFGRQALHARTLELIHPHSHRSMRFTSALPDDMANLLLALEDG
jgi:23S rRNA pseudouridine1911/1915/1917 synthase